jgi:UDPglucose 6-dehydrogenase
MKICVVGSGYVGLSLAILLSRHFKVKLLDVSEEKIKFLNNKVSPVDDREIQEYLTNHQLSLDATLIKEKAYFEAEYVIVATPTNYDISTSSFDTSTVENVISDCLKYNESASIIIKSTVPIGFTNKMKIKFNKNEILFSPEFLRESKALYDNLYPSRIVVGGEFESAHKFGRILLECSNKKEAPLLLMNTEEAEAVKLFSNTFLAMRVSFFNELDSFSEIYDLSARKIIEGVSADERIGNYYNNPSFGYGGYCLPKDTKQLLDNFNDIPNNIIKAVVEANQTRKKFIVNSIMNKSPKTVGIYRLIMKNGSDNFRESAILDILSELKKNGVNIVLYEPYLKKKNFNGIHVVKDLNEFFNSSDLIIANRLSNELESVVNKVYTRDIFGEN